MNFMIKGEVVALMLSGDKPRMSLFCRETVSLYEVGLDNPQKFQNTLGKEVTLMVAARPFNNRIYLKEC